MVVNIAFMGHVGVAKEEIMIANTRRSIGSRASMNGYIFAKCVVVTYDELSLFALLLKILGHSSEHGKGEGPAAFPDSGITFDDDVAVQVSFPAKDDIIPNHTIRPNFTIRTNLCFW